MTPIYTFLSRLSAFGANEIAVLFGMIGLQEISEPIGLISPAVKKRLWSVESMSSEELDETVERLVKAGEVEWVESEEGFRGYRVRRFEELQELMMEFGRKRYYRKKARESRQRKLATCREAATSHV